MKRQNRFFKVIILAGCFGACASIYAETLPIVEGKFLGLFGTPSSEYSIYVEAKTPGTVKLAAEEMQRVIAVSTGVKLPIVNQPATPMICIGDNDSAKEAGLLTGNMADDSFQILTKNQNLYIAGKDTPDNFKWKGWESRGTLFGVYEFLEREVGVRWLMPGDVGEEIPSLGELTVSEIVHKESPAFFFRSLVDIQNQIRSPNPKDNGPEQVDRWLLRQKCPNASDGLKSTRDKIQYGHAWSLYINTEDLKAHPEFQAVRGGKDKFCTTNPDVIKLFSKRVIEWLDKHPDSRSAGISPEDGGDFCKCPRCMALTTKDWHGNLSYTPVILKFYNDVGKIVAEKYPDRFLGGFIYYNYMYPPATPVAMEPNVYLFMAPLNYYGWGLAKPSLQEEFPKLISAWTSTTKNFGYINWSLWFKSLNGAPLPPGLPILKQEMPILHKYGVQYVTMIGIGAWGYGGPENYIITKLLWSGDADVDALFQEWLQKTYGPAWPTMKQFYMMIEDRVLERKRNETPKYIGDNYEANADFIGKVYKPVFPEMERLYRQALSQVKTEKQRKRLEMLGDNLIMLHYSLRKANMLEEPEKSFFYRSDEVYQKFLADTEFSLSLYRDHGNRDLPPIYDGSFSGEGENPPMETRKLTIPKISEGASAPVIDGDISDAVWQTGATADMLRLIGTRDPAIQKTITRILYDKENIYIAFSCMEDSPDKILQTVVNHDDSVFSDDCIEIMLAVFPNAKQKFWHLALNPANAQWDGIVKTPEENLEWKSAVKIGSKGWTAEISISFKNLGIEEPQAGKTWKANLTRTETPHGECSAWNAVYRSFLEVYSFGEWTFAP